MQDIKKTKSAFALTIICFCCLRAFEYAKLLLMGGNDLKNYIEESRKRGISDAMIRDSLIKHGWQQNLVEGALSQKAADNSAAVPAPPPAAQHFGMWIAFLYIILFISLYVTATAFAGILHQFVDDKIPDALSASKYYYSSTWQYTLIQAYLSSLIVGFPIFAGLFIFLKNQTLKNPEIKGIRARKLLVYATLVGTFMIMIANLISTVYNFLGGTVTARTLGHLGVTFFVAGAIFIYFILDIWGDRKQS